MGKAAVQIGNKLEQRLWQAAIHHRGAATSALLQAALACLPQRWSEQPPSAYTGAAWGGCWEAGEAQLPALASIGLSSILTSLSIQPLTETLMASAGIRQGTGHQNT